MMISLAFYGTEFITAVKGFVGLVNVRAKKESFREKERLKNKKKPGDNPIKLFTVVI
jgi:hypothetical protein